MDRRQSPKPTMAELPYNDVPDESAAEKVDNQPSQIDPDQDLEPFAWDDLERRFVQAMEQRTIEETKLVEEAQNLFKVLQSF